MLIVEDESMLRQIMVRTLEEREYRVLAAEDGAVAWELLQLAGGGIHAIVADVILPKLGGVELAARVEALPGAPPIALVSGYEKPAALPDHPFLAKPFDPEQLATMVKQLLDNTQSGNTQSGRRTPVAQTRPGTR